MSGTTQPTLFKVLTKEGLPAHGGNGLYDLPKDGVPGAWTKPIKPQACERGYHLTTRPAKWWVPGARLFVAEAIGDLDFSPPDKVACERIRLREEVTPAWAWLSLFPEIKARLVSNWRMNNPAPAKFPSWADLSRAYLSGAYLSGAYLSGAYLGGAYLSGADLSGADLSGADLSGADLSWADLSGADLSWADLSRAYLSGAYLSGAYLSGADLSRAYLSRAYLSWADLSGADLSWADLSGADLPAGYAQPEAAK